MRAFLSSFRAASLAVLTLALQPLHAATNARGHAVDVIDLPGSNAEANAYAIDLNGDGNPENQFGSILVVMAKKGTSKKGTGGVSFQRYRLAEIPRPHFFPRIPPSPFFHAVCLRALHSPAVAAR